MKIKYLRAGITFLLGYALVTWIAIGTLFLLRAIFNLPSWEDQGIPMMQDQAYKLSEKLHPFNNLVIWPFMAAIYFRKVESLRLRDALNLGIHWTVAAILVDFVGFVLIQHPFSVSFKEFYFDYQPWISLIYLAILFGPMLYYWFRIIRKKSGRGNDFGNAGRAKGKTAA